MITEIGITAGEIWRVLDEKGPLEVSIINSLIPGGEDLLPSWLLVGSAVKAMSS